MPVTFEFGKSPVPVPADEFAPYLREEISWDLYGGTDSDGCRRKDGVRISMPDGVKPTCLWTSFAAASQHDGTGILQVGFSFGDMFQMVSKEEYRQMWHALYERLNPLFVPGFLAQKWDVTSVNESSYLITRKQKFQIPVGQLGFAEVVVQALQDFLDGFQISQHVREWDLRLPRHQASIRCWCDNMWVDPAQYVMKKRGLMDRVVGLGHCLDSF